MLFFLTSLFLGAAAGLSAGLFGIGGGVIIVPMLVWLLPTQGISEDVVMIMAVATSLATIIFTASSSLFAHHQRGYVLWERVRYLSFGIVFGVMFGALTASHISSEHLQIAFGIFLIFNALQMFFQVLAETEEAEKEEPLLDYMIGMAIGFVSAISGTGGGTLTVPYLVHRRVKIKNAVAISSACSLPIAFGASLSYAFLGLQHSGLPEASLGYIYLPAFLGITACSIFVAPLGAKLAHVLPSEKLKRYFALVLFIFAVKMLW